MAAIAALDDDVRRSLYEHVRRAGVPVTREEAATAVGISSKLAAFHLDKLVELGRAALRASGRRRAGGWAGRRGSTSRPRSDIAVRVPERSPELLASILVEAVTTEQQDERAEAAVLRVAGERGVALGADERARLRGGRVGAERALATSEELLARQGFEPFREDGLGAAAQLPVPPDGRDGAGAGLRAEPRLPGRGLEGLDAGDRVAAELAPRAGECCVELRSTSSPAQSPA